MERIKVKKSEKHGKENIDQERNITLFAARALLGLLGETGSSFFRLGGSLARNAFCKGSRSTKVFTEARQVNSAEGQSRIG